ncbi:S8 family serine peptidase [Hymenobacter psychrophilus]|uniref:Serine protease, subtilisin family n=1 Tax=Hymenobacter psychrophilus TaxID=651662 RepID=A0A1H3CVQ0_9BACT|nr:S8 family serine peptidase [Hymenobacter psychrophilus]SDX57644.1 Serine protease, subtilisin family [Hymenobacter psychrophilus]
MLGLLAWLPATAQRPAAPAARYWVTFRDKGGQTLQPATYFDAAAQARRRRQHLPAFDSTDLPVRPDYLGRVRTLTDSVTLVSRWFNAVACLASPAQAAQLRRLPGVRRVEAWPVHPLLAAHRPSAAGPLPVRLPAPLTPADLALARRQTAALGAAEFRRAGQQGQGLRIAVFDVGFRGTDTHPAFAHLYRRQAIAATYDFLRRAPDVYRGGTHGTEVLSCLAGQLPDSTFLGLAPAAEFLLARTEQQGRERYAEEEAWLAAAEWADRHGADIINSSLGYTDRRYFPEQMDGRTSLVARAAAMAVRKGMLVVNAAGNAGDDPNWRSIGTPADADSVLTVGGLDPDTFLHLDFSSYGPAAGGRLKPNLAAFGVAVTAVPGGFERAEGTSFASPLVAGFAACAWQQQRDLPVMALFDRLQQAGQLYPYFDYAHGYGLPQAAAFRAVGPPPALPAPTFDFVVADSVVSVFIRPEAATVPTYTLPLLAATAPQTALGAVGPAAGAPAAATAPAAPLYWQLRDATGFIVRYEVLEVSQRAVLRVPLRQLPSGGTLRVHFRGYTASFEAP